MHCMCFCVGGLYPKAPFILCGKSYLEARKTYGCSALYRTLHFIIFHFILYISYMLLVF